MPERSGARRSLDPDLFDGSSRDVAAGDLAPVHLDGAPRHGRAAGARQDCGDAARLRSEPGDCAKARHRAVRPGGGSFDRFADLSIAGLDRSDG